MQQVKPSTRQMVEDRVVDWTDRLQDLSTDIGDILKAIPADPSPDGSPRRLAILRTKVDDALAWADSIYLRLGTK